MCLLGDKLNTLMMTLDCTNVILDIYGGATAGKRGILSLSGRVGSDNGDIGTIWFNNDNNSSQSPGNTMKLCAAIRQNQLLLIVMQVVMLEQTCNS